MNTMNIVAISIAVTFAMLTSFNHTFAQTNIVEEQYSQVSCEELDQFYKIIDKFVDWQGDPQMSDEEYHTAQEVELAMVHELGCEEYMAGADLKGILLNLTLKYTFFGDLRIVNSTLCYIKKETSAHLLVFS